MSEYQAQMMYPVEYLKTIVVCGIPSYVVQIKVGTSNSFNINTSFIKFYSTNHHCNFRRGDFCYAVNCNLRW